MIVPTVVSTRGPRGIYAVFGLAARDFHLFEDGKEQTVESATLVRDHASFLADNRGFLLSRALTPMGMWTNLYPNWTVNYPAAPYYFIAYRPPFSPEGRCHKINIKVAPFDESGHNVTTAETPLTAGIVTAVVDRRSLFLVYRTQYCNVTHSASDPLYGTPASAMLESAVNNDRGQDKGLYLRAIDFYDESNASRVRVALDFPHLSSQADIPGFHAALLGMFSKINGSLAARFSDSRDEPCLNYFGETDQELRLTCGHFTHFNHYDTEVNLPPGDYALQVSIDYGGTLRRA